MEIKDLPYPAQKKVRDYTIATYGFGVNHVHDFMIRLDNWMKVNIPKTVGIRVIDHNWRMGITFFSITPSPYKKKLARILPISKSEMSKLQDVVEKYFGSKFYMQSFGDKHIFVSKNKLRRRLPFERLSMFSGFVIVLQSGYHNFDEEHYYTIENKRVSELWSPETFEDEFKQETGLKFSSGGYFS
jgi:hypothetical protein